MQYHISEPDKVKHHLHNVSSIIIIALKKYGELEIPISLLEHALLIYCLQDCNDIKRADPVPGGSHLSGVLGKGYRS